MALATANGNRSQLPLTNASVAGLLIRLDDDVWVDMLMASVNADFVNAAPKNESDATDEIARPPPRRPCLGGLVWDWLPPVPRPSRSPRRPENHFVVSHGGGTRLAAIRGAQCPASPARFHTRTATTLSLSMPEVDILRVC